MVSPSHHPPLHLISELYNTLQIMGERTWTGVISYAVILLVFIIMGMMLMDSRNLNQAHSDEIQQTNKDFKKFKDKSERQLEDKNTEINAR